MHYFRTGRIPDGFSLRLLDLTFPKPGTDA
jgi:hypothetical protein